jgi:hypothetical protein
MYDLDQYINDATAQGVLVHFASTTDADQACEQFEQLIEFDRRRISSPLLVYEYQQLPQAVFNCITLEGYILEKTK